jgi:hypothetical protein
MGSRTDQRLKQTEGPRITPEAFPLLVCVRCRTGESTPTRLRRRSRPGRRKPRNNETLDHLLSVVDARSVRAIRVPLQAIPKGRERNPVVGFNSDSETKSRPRAIEREGKYYRRSRQADRRPGGKRTSPSIGHRLQSDIAFSRVANATPSQIQPHHCSYQVEPTRRS